MNRNSLTTTQALGMLIGLALLAPPAEAVEQAPAATVHVADFEIDPRMIKSERSPLPPPLPGPLGRALPRPPGVAEDPPVRAAKLVDAMAQAIVVDLRKKGVNARRLPAGEKPAQGWLVSGRFTEVDEGDRMQRAVVGFGAGQTALQVVVTTRNLAGHEAGSTSEVTAGAESRQLPGAIVTMNPYVAAARFVMAGGDLSKNVRQTASNIAAAVLRDTRASGAAGRCDAPCNTGGTK